MSLGITESQVPGSPMLQVGKLRQQGRGQVFGLASSASARPGA